MNQSLSQPLNQVSEEICNELIDSFRKFRENASDFANTFSEISETIWKSELNFAEIKIILYTTERLIYSERLKTSNVLTRWYWRKKLYTATVSLRKYKQMKSYIEIEIELNKTI